MRPEAGGNATPVDGIADQKTPETLGATIIEGDQSDSNDAENPGAGGEGTPGDDSSNSTNSTNARKYSTCRRKSSSRFGLKVSFCHITTIVSLLMIISTINQT